MLNLFEQSVTIKKNCGKDNAIMEYKMILTQEEQDILNGSKGETMAKVMKTLVLYGEAFGATKMVPVESKMGHLVTSFGLKVMKPV